jgi:hypothetical protein
MSSKQGEAQPVSVQKEKDANCAKFSSGVLDAAFAPS